MHLRNPAAADLANAQPVARGFGAAQPRRHEQRNRGRRRSTHQQSTELAPRHLVGMPGSSWVRSSRSHVSLLLPHYSNFTIALPAEAVQSQLEPCSTPIHRIARLCSTAKEKFALLEHFALQTWVAASVAYGQRADASASSWTFTVIVEAECCTLNELPAKAP